MSDLQGILWIELRKIFRSKIPLWTSLGSVLMPLGIAFLIFVSKNPEISKKLGLISVKADLIAYSATDWQTYIGLSGMMIAAGGFVIFVIIISWVFGREFVDRTLKDMLAVPIKRSKIILGKFIVSAILSAMLTIVILIVSLVMGAVIKLPGGSLNVILNGIALVFISAGLTFLVVVPFGFLASIGRGYLLPVGAAVLTLIMTNIIALAGWGEVFPWAIPGLFAQGKITQYPLSIFLVAVTCLIGMAATYTWYKYADQHQ